MKIKREKHEVMGSVFWLFQIEETSFAIRADKQGIRFLGDSPYLENQEELQEFAKLVADAWREHHKLKPRLTTNLAGH
jgi:hypothetical protein